MSPRRASGDETRLVAARCVLDGCGRKFQYDPQNLKGSAFPFCSRRCQGVDLGNWIDETYRIEGIEGIEGDDIGDLEDAGD